MRIFYKNERLESERIPSRPVCNEAFSWEEIVETEGNTIKGLTALGKIVAERSMCELEWFGDCFFRDAKELLETNGEDFCVVRLISSIFTNGIEKCNLFADKLIGLGLDRFLSNYTFLPEVMFCFSEMCLYSEQVTDHVANLGVLDMVLGRYYVNDRDISQPDLWFILSFLENCNEALIPKIIRLPLSVSPPIEDENFFKHWVLRMCEILRRQRIVNLVQNEFVLRKEFNVFFGRICELLESDNTVYVKGSLKLLLSITCSTLINREEGFSFMLLNRVWRCLLKEDEGVHLGVCKVLCNLVSCGIVFLKDLTVDLVSDFIKRSLMYGCELRKESVGFLVHNIVSKGTDYHESRLKAIFNESLLKEYFIVLIGKLEEKVRKEDVIEEESKERVEEIQEETYEEEMKEIEENGIKKEEYEIRKREKEFQEKRTMWQGILDRIIGLWLNKEESKQEEISCSALESLPKLIGFAIASLDFEVESFNMFHEYREALPQEGKVEKCYGYVSHRFLVLNPIDDYNPWSDFGSCEPWTSSEMDQHVPVTWGPYHEDEFAAFLYSGDDTGLSIRTIGKKPPHDATKIFKKVWSETFLDLFEMIVSVGGCMSDWKPGDALCNHFRQHKEFIVPLHWYGEAYDSVKEYCLEFGPSGKLRYYLMRGSWGTGKSLFVTYLVCRWLNESNWYNEHGSEIDTIIIIVSSYENGMGEGTYGFGLRKLKNGSVVCFVLGSACKPVRGDIVVSFSFLIRFDYQHKLKIDEIGSYVEPFDMSTTLFIFETSLDVELIGSKIKLALGITCLHSKERDSARCETVTYVPCPTTNDIGRICYLLKKTNVQGEEKRKDFKECFDISGNRVSMCFWGKKRCLRSVKGSLRRIGGKWKKLNRNDGQRKVFSDRIDGFFKVVLVRCAPWKGFDSMRDFEVEYWSDFLVDKVSDGFSRYISYMSITKDAYLTREKCLPPSEQRMQHMFMERMLKEKNKIRQAKEKKKKRDKYV
jgi:hypothetical protein